MDDQQSKASPDQSKLQAGRGVPAEQDNLHENTKSAINENASETSLADRIRKAGV